MVANAPRTIPIRHTVTTRIIGIQRCILVTVYPKVGKRRPFLRCSNLRAPPSEREDDSSAVFCASACLRLFALREYNMPWTSAATTARRNAPKTTHCRTCPTDVAKSLSRSQPTVRSPTQPIVCDHTQSNPFARPNQMNEPKPITTANTKEPTASRPTNLVALQTALAS